MTIIKIERYAIKKKPKQPYAYYSAPWRLKPYHMCIIVDRKKESRKICVFDTGDVDMNDKLAKICLEALNNG